MRNYEVPVTAEQTPAFRLLWVIPQILVTDPWLMPRIMITARAITQSMSEYSVRS
jgi:hypothetical protein